MERRVGEGKKMWRKEREGGRVEGRHVERKERKTEQRNGGIEAAWRKYGGKIEEWRKESEDGRMKDEKSGGQVRVVERRERTEGNRGIAAAFGGA